MAHCSSVIARGPRLKPLGFGAVKPLGWLQERLVFDLEEGIPGHLERLVPEVMTSDDLYGRDRRSGATRDAGTDVSPFAVSWWNSESQSNLWDGIVRAAVLTGLGDAMERARRWVDGKLATQDEDGYLGIHAPDLRHRPDEEDGDLWAKTTLLRALLAWAEGTGDGRALAAARRAVDRTMRAWPAGASHPFRAPGVGHSLLFTDVLETLERLTGERAYLDYAAWLVAEFDRDRDEDTSPSRLLDARRPFEGHGVHAYEGLRPVVAAYRATGATRYERAVAAWVAKTEYATAPSGGPSGDEWVAGRAADAADVGYEVCSIHEALDSYRSLLALTGDPAFADRIEWLLFNAAQGARYPDGRSIAYCKTDDSLSMTGPLRPGGGIGAGIDPAHAGAGPETGAPVPPQRRFKYSPVHQDVAVCCAPNAGRIHPYFVEAMWLGRPDGLQAALYGPCAVRATVDGVAVTIRQETRYPFEPVVRLLVEPSAPVAFTLGLRRPSWATWMRVDGVLVEGHPELRRTWRAGDHVRIEFGADVRRVPAGEGRAHLAWGPLAFALPLRGRSRVVRRWDDGFVDRKVFPAGPDGSSLALPTDAVFTLRRGRWSRRSPWRTLRLEGALRDLETGADVPVRLVPLGATVLRRLTFRTTRG